MRFWPMAILSLGFWSCMLLWLSYIGALQGPLRYCLRSKDTECQGPEISPIAQRQIVVNGRLEWFPRRKGENVKLSGLKMGAWKFGWDEHTERSSCSILTKKKPLDHQVSHPQRSHGSLYLTLPWWTSTYLQFLHIHHKVIVNMHPGNCGVDLEPWNMEDLIIHTISSTNLG